MRAAPLTGISRRKFVTTTVRDVGRQFTAERPNGLWVADITYVPAWAGCVYLAVVLAAFSRPIAGWPPSAQARLRRWGQCPCIRRVVLDALEMALKMRRPKDMIHHCDQATSC